MLSFLKRAGGSLLFSALKIIRGTVVRSLKIEALKFYIRLIAAARQFTILVLAVSGILLLATVAFVMIHAGVLILLPVSLAAKGWIILALGIIYAVISFCFIRAICSEKLWLKLSKASEMINSVVKK